MKTFSVDTQFAAIHCTMATKGTPDAPLIRVSRQQTLIDYAEAT
jgi:hypothetical protein